jgi:predicted permease
MRIALRSLVRTPVISLAVILSLGLGIGANTAIFSLMHQALLKSLPVRNPEEIVLVTAPGDLKGGRSSTDNSGGMDHIFSYPMFRGLERSSKGLTGLAAHRGNGANIAFQGKTRNGHVDMVSGGFFNLLGVQPLLGRLLAARDDQPGSAPAVVLGYGYWKDRLGGRADVLNQPIRVNNQIFTVVGVTPAEFYGLTLGSEPDVYAPLVYKPALIPDKVELQSWTNYYLYLVGRRAPGFSMEQAAAALNSVYTGLKEQQLSVKFFGDDQRRERFRQSQLLLAPGAQGYSAMRQGLETPLHVLLICTALVVLIAAANAANLMLARAARREKEMAIRAAMGAGRWQIVRQLLTEAMLLAGGGGVAGIISGMWMLSVLLALMANGEDPSHALSATLDSTALAYSAAVTLLAGLIFGLYPAWRASRVSLSSTIKEESSQSSATRGGVRVRRTLVVVQVGLSLLLLIPTGLFLKSMVNLMHVDLGVRGDHLLTFGISPSLNGYTPQRSEALFERAEAELRAIPGVIGVTSVWSPLVAGSTSQSDIEVEGLKHDRQFDATSVINGVGPGFFREMGVPLLEGRDIVESDTASSPKIAVVNQAWVNHFSPDRPAMGRRFSFSGGKTYDMEVVGVVGNLRIADVKEPPKPQFFAAYRQSPEQADSLTFYVRSPLPTEQTSAAIRRVMSGLDPDLPLENFRTFEAQVARRVKGERMTLTFAAAFAALATLLAMLGLYGVLAFNVARRTREIGIRMALGAGVSSIGRMVMREVAVVLGVGAVIGVPAALALARFAQSELYGVKPFDLTVVVAALVALAVAALLAGLTPARRAARISPIEALRYE